MSEPDNLSLWRSVERTDPAHVKPITGKQYRGTSPKPYWLVQQATRVFGPCGIGWGYTIEERIEDGVKDDQGRAEKLSIAKVKVWYLWNGQRGEVEHIGGTPFSGWRKTTHEAFIDEDAPKKSVTDALVKALSMIGFAGDIFMGRYDDSKYVQEIRDEIAKEQRAEPPSTPVQQWVEWMATNPDIRAVNARLTKASELKAGDKPKIRDMIQRYARNQGWTLDNETKQYFAPEVAKV